MGHGIRFPVGRQRTMVGRQRALLRWYRAHGRHRLPWRHTRDPYRVLVSEVMLQQTQVDRVLSYWRTWVRRWPTFASLARASRADVIRAWAGLGYNRRAVHLHALAQEVVCTTGTPHLFSFTHDVCARAEALQQLPGIGPYTANALFAFVWNLPAPCVDTNVRRVLAHAIYRRPAIMRMPLREVMRLAQRIIPSGRGRDWNYALMDYGALVLTARAVQQQVRPQGSAAGDGNVGQLRRAGKFEGSSRFWRGRIVAVLRDARRPITRAAMRRTLSVHGEVPGLHTLLTALLEDRLIRRVGYTFTIG